MNDERPIETLLRRYAKKRRDDAGAPLELHPATRRLLQGEVTRQFRQSAAGGAAVAPGLKNWWPRLVWALPVLVVLGVGVWALVRTKEKSGHEFELAKNFFAADEFAKKAPASAEPAKDFFKALETPPPPAAPALVPPAGGDPSTGAFASGAPARNERARTVTVTGSLESDRDRLLPEDALRRSPTATATLAGRTVVVSDGEVKQKLGEAPGAVDEAARLARADKLREHSLEARPAPIEPPAVVAGEKIQAGNVAVLSPGKGKSFADLADDRTDLIGAVGGQRASAPASASAPLGLSLNQPAKGPESAGTYGFALGQAQVARQGYVQMGLRSRYATVDQGIKTEPVLASFQVEQAGDRVRVIDSDGSTYTGALEESKVERSTSGVGEEKGAAGLLAKRDLKTSLPKLNASQTAGVPPAQNYFYRVEGTNRTLNQTVVFTWNFVALTNELAAAQTKAGAGGGNIRAVNLPAQQFPLLLNNAINGRAQLGAGKEFEIQAVPVSP